MLTDTLVLTGTVATSFIRRSDSGSSSIWVPTGDTPQQERKVRVAHEMTKSGTVNSLFAVSRLKLDTNNPTAAPRAAMFQSKIVRPSFFTEADMLAIIRMALTGLVTKDGAAYVALATDTLDPVKQLLNQER